MRVIIIGAGDVGFNIAKRLVAENKEVVIVDVNKDMLSKIENELDVETIVGSGNSPKILKQAGIEEATLLLAVTNSDEINLIACSIASLLAPNIFKIARIRNPEYNLYKEKLIKNFFKIDIVINPEEETVNQILQLIEFPFATDIFEFKDLGIKLIGVTIREQSPIRDLTLMELKNKIGLKEFIIGSIIRNNELIIPRGEDKILVGDTIYFVCSNEHLSELFFYFNVTKKMPKDFLIVGGGNVGFTLAKSLEQRKGVNVKLIEADKERCEFLAENLKNTMVLHGDGTDQTLLMEENAGDMDVFIAVTGDEENNILSSLLAKNLGVTHTITKINKQFYLDLLKAIGLENVVSPRLCAANSILKYVRKGKVISSISLKEDAEVIEIMAKANSFLVDNPLKKLKFPKGAIILCIVRDKKVIIPTGEDIITVNDRVFILSKTSVVSKIEKIISQ